MVRVHPAVPSLFLISSPSDRGRPKHLGARVGITAVLHTCGSAHTHHPHVHMIVPGGGIALDGKRWISCRPGFCLRVRVVSRLFRRLFLDRLTAAHRQLGVLRPSRSTDQCAGRHDLSSATAQGRVGRLFKTPGWRPRGRAGLAKTFKETDVEIRRLKDRIPKRRSMALGQSHGVARHLTPASQVVTDLNGTAGTRPDAECSRFVTPEQGLLRTSPKD